MRPVILLLVVLSVYDASGQADPDDGGKVDYAGDYAGKDDKARDVDAPDVSADVSDSRSVKAHHKHSKRVSLTRYSILYTFVSSNERIAIRSLGVPPPPPIASIATP